MKQQKPQLLKLQLYNYSKQLLRSEIYCPFSEHTRYLMRQQNVPIFPASIYNESLPTHEILANLQQQIKESRISPYWDFTLDAESLIYQRFVLAFGPSCAHYVSNVKFKCEECQNFFGCVHCHSDSFGFEMPHDFVYNNTVQCVCGHIQSDSDSCVQCGADLRLYFFSKQQTKAFETPVSENTCCVCQGEFSDYFKEFTMSCGHQTHLHCFYNLKQNCPVCLNKIELLNESQKIVQYVYQRGAEAIGAECGMCGIAFKCYKHKFGPYCCVCNQQCGVAALSDIVEQQNAQMMQFGCNTEVIDKIRTREEFQGKTDEQITEELEEYLQIKEVPNDVAFGGINLAIYRNALELPFKEFKMLCAECIAEVRGLEGL
ncbi:Zinc_finger domain-containing protein [Hexamita inflata]|uniref:Zinc finger domain-containing protein n=1 Tax=Hexamita inflata TaxID=28002 RepID=A0AA86Q1F0_9EUKA|nr:Zinc finger domain-containing protein [Hexamita inflata]